ncbi:amino acid synthesis family protein [Mesorhizobium sp. YC-39]|uniref:amino acid synthesis family protein n=1 Tax=unclassified Mesorhizobium TaxID=325217 RepID=UPI0021E892B8|nr:MULTISPECIES: amino acid synthesis family protein [unclassified Mesorhizobium]MCV3211198.1 amino acid synthesis family protein [Mesorhizobium sp. YC-2]MCV3232923.1 amino acid synthesis family protein [Mesorhizobium sp. YC-39]
MNYSSEVERDYDVRGWYSSVQESRHDGGKPGETLVKVATGVVIRNPFAGKFVAELSDLTNPSSAIGHALGERAVALLGNRPVESYGKGGIAGTAGEQEHVVACITTVFGDPLRQQVGGGKAWISSVSKVAVAGTAIDIPLAHKDELYIRSHYDAVTFSVPDAPRPDELLICVAVASGPRVHQRVGGKSVADLKAAAV